MLKPRCERSPLGSAYELAYYEHAVAFAPAKSHAGPSLSICGWSIFSCVLTMSNALIVCGNVYMVFSVDLTYIHSALRAKK